MPGSEKKSAVRFHPVRPVAGPAAPEGKPGREQKGVPDGREGEFGSHIDDPHDLPPDYYHDMWRQRDHGRHADAKERKAARDRALGWQRRFSEFQVPDSFVRPAAHKYKQPVGYCFAICVAFFYMRRMGLTPALAIATLRMPWFVKNIRRIPLSRGLLSGLEFGKRTACPFVFLYASCLVGGVTEGHQMLVDFSDPLHPGIFDPEFGWMEPLQGYCFADFEVALHSLWESHTKHNSGLPYQGVRHHINIDEKEYFLSFQLYEQTRMG